MTNPDDQRLTVEEEQHVDAYVARLLGGVGGSFTPQPDSTPKPPERDQADEDAAFKAYMRSAFPGAKEIR